MTTEQQNALTRQLWLVVDFCLERRGRRCLVWAKDRAFLFRYVASCYFTGKLNVAWEAGKITAVVFAWSDRIELIEHKDEQGLSQFEWGSPRKGDSVFVSDVIGSRRGVAALYQKMIENHPHLMTVQFYTIRHNKLVCLSKDRLERLFERTIK